MPFYYVSNANSWLAVTGVGVVGDIRICRKAFRFPRQKIMRISVTPFDMSLTIQAMTHEKLSLALPVMFTVGPESDPETLKKYCILLTGNPRQDSEHVQNVIKGVIEGEIRVLIAKMSMEELFQGRQQFKENITKHIQSELDQFGIKIYNANVKELHDTEGSEYFKFMRKRATEGAEAQAKVEVASARMTGEIGEREKQGLTKQRISQIEAQTAINETIRKKEKAAAEADLKKRTVELDMDIKVAQITARRVAESKDAELQKEVEEKRAETEYARLQATDLTVMRINREKMAQQADAELYTAQRKADAEFYAQQKESEATQMRRKIDAEAALYAREKEAEGIGAVYQAQYAGFLKLKEAFGSDEMLMQFLMLEKGTFLELAQANASAIQGLNPKINVWNTGAQSGGENGGADTWSPIRNLFTTIPPVLAAMQGTTGMKAPSWFMDQTEVPQHETVEKLEDAKKRALSNSTSSSPELIEKMLHAN